MFISVHSLVIMGIGTLVTIFFLIMLITSGKYDMYLETLDSKEYPFFQLYGVGFRINDLIRMDFSRKSERKRRQHLALLKGDQLAPYRYILGGLSGSSISTIEDNISNDVKKEIQDGSMVFFSGSNANYVGTDNEKVATFNNYVVYSTFIVQVNYKLKLPIRFLGDDYYTVLNMSSRAEVAIDDCAEFVRNVDMVADLFEDTKAGDTIKSTFKKINSFIEQFSK